VQRHLRTGDGAGFEPTMQFSLPRCRRAAVLAAAAMHFVAAACGSAGRSDPQPDGQQGATGDAGSDVASAMTMAGRGTISLQQGEYLQAAVQYREASNLVHPASVRARAFYLNASARALVLLGDDRDDASAVRQAIDMYRTALSVLPREQAPRAWAGTQINLAVALRMLGERERRAEHLEAAAAAFRAALDEFPAEREPAIFVMVQNNLGRTLEALAALTDGMSFLEEAVAAYAATLNVFPAPPPDYARQAKANLARATALLDARKAAL
jgi:tetratricopeptide (TPR) repeat protein